MSKNEIWCYCYEVSLLTFGTQIAKTFKLQLWSIDLPSFLSQSLKIKYSRPLSRRFLPHQCPSTFKCKSCICAQHWSSPSLKEKQLSQSEHCSDFKVTGSYIFLIVSLTQPFKTFFKYLNCAKLYVIKDNELNVLI